MSRPGRPRMEMDDLYTKMLICCPKCSKPFKRFTELERHLINDHDLNRIIREQLYESMGMNWYQNYDPPGFWAEMWIE